MIDSDVMTESSSTRTILGLKPNLWRLAIIVGLAQTSMSIWSWQFTIFLEGIILPWQMGITLSTAMVASLIGYLTSGYISDYLGRKRTLILAFIPMTIGLYIFSLFPVWPLIPLEVAVVQFGWSFVIIISRAFPADIIASEKAKDPARKFMMVLLPAFAMDGISPIIGANLLSIGLQPTDLYMIAAIVALISLVVSSRFIRESLSDDTIKQAKIGPKITFRNLGNNFWFMVAGMFGFTFFFNTALPYWGNLVVGEYAGVDIVTFGYVYSSFSLTSAIMMYFSSHLADRNLKKALLGAVLSNALVMFLFGVFTGIIELFILTIIWSIPVSIWIGAERSLVVEGVNDTMKGRALGTYQFLMTSAGVFASPLGAFLWEFTGSWRTVYIFCGIESLAASGLLYLALENVRQNVAVLEEDLSKPETQILDK
jgi:MFS family permease